MSDPGAVPVGRRVGHRIALFAPIYCYCVAIVVSCRNNEGTRGSITAFLEGLSNIIKSNNNAAPNDSPFPDGR